jgi:hypothetical protein
VSADPTQPPTPPPPPTEPTPAQPGEPPGDEGGRSFWVIVAIVVAVLVIAGFVATVALSGNDEGPSQTGPTTQTGAAPTGPTATAPTGATGATEPTSENLGCGTSAPDSLPDGRYFGFVRDVETASGTMAFDLACFYTGEEANQQAAMRGDEVPVPNDVYIVNDNPGTRPLTLAPSVELRLIDWNDCCDTAPGADLDAFASTIDSNGFTNIGGWRYTGQNSPYWVTIQDGDVVLIEEQFLP